MVKPVTTAMACDGNQPEVDRQWFYRRAADRGRSDRRVVQIGDGDQLQQQVDRMAAEDHATGFTTIPTCRWTSTRASVRSA